MVAVVEPAGEDPRVAFFAVDGRELASYPLPAAGDLLAVPGRWGVIIGEQKSGQIFEVTPRQGPSRLLGAGSRLGWLAAARDGTVLAGREGGGGRGVVPSPIGGKTVIFCRRPAEMGVGQSPASCPPAEPPFSGRSGGGGRAGDLLLPREE